MLVKDIVTEMDSIILVEMMGSRGAEHTQQHLATWDSRCQVILRKI